MIRCDSLWGVRTIRSVKSRDYENILRLIRENHCSLPPLPSHPAAPNEQLARWIACGELGPACAAFLDERIVGLCFLDGCEEDIRVPTLVVITDSRIRGRAPHVALIRAALEQAKACPFRKLRLSLAAEDFGVLGIYRNLGFSEAVLEMVRTSRGGAVKRVILLKELH